LFLAFGFAYFFLHNKKKLLFRTNLKKNTKMYRLITQACATRNYTLQEIWCETLGVPYTTANACSTLRSLTDKGFTIENAFDVLAHIGRVDTVDIGHTRRYRGVVQSSITSLIYILNRYENVCVAAWDLRLARERPADWFDLGIVWEKDALRPVDSDAMHKELARCQKRFTVVILTIKKRTSAHANMLLIDNLNRVVERYDPYGTSSADTNLDSALTKLFKVTHRYVRPPPRDVFRELEGIQILQEREGERSELDPVGYCQPFCFLYLECRLTFPDMDAIAARDVIVHSARVRAVSLTEFIRAYTSGVEQETANILVQFKNGDINLNTLLVRELTRER
jgi:hypothetical protein